MAALLLAVALLCGCAAQVTVQRIPAELPKAESPAATPTPEPTPTFTEEQKYGSAPLLSEPTVLVSVLNDAAHGLTWDEADRTAAVQQTRMAVDWITAQAESYGVMPDLICDRTEDGSNAALTRSYLVQSAMRGGEDSDESTAFIEEMDALCESLAADSRLAVYGTRHIGFLFYLPISGTSFTMAHYADDGEYFYYEYSCLYRHDAYTDGERKARRPTPTRSCTCSEHLTFTRAAATLCGPRTGRLRGRDLPRRHHGKHLRGRWHEPV